jgi:hypothetical protein
MGMLSKPVYWRVFSSANLVLRGSSDSGSEILPRLS